jgi:hypothetical protein
MVRAGGLGIHFIVQRSNPWPKKRGMNGGKAVRSIPRN